MRIIEEKKKKTILIIIITFLWIISLVGMFFYVSAKSIDTYEMMYEIGIEDGKVYQKNIVIKELYDNSLDCGETNLIEVVGSDNYLVYYPYSCVDEKLLLHSDSTEKFIYK